MNERRPDSTQIIAGHLAHTIAGQARAVADGKVYGSQFELVQRLLENAQMLSDITVDDRV